MNDVVKGAVDFVKEVAEETKPEDTKPEEKADDTTNE